MKKFLTLLALVLCALVASAQKENICYSFVIKDANGNLVADRDVKIKVQLLYGSIAVDPDKIPAGAISNTEYAETHSVKTDNNGVASILIGTGEVISSVFKELSKFPFSGSNRITIEIDPDGNGYSIKGSSLLTSVPSALYATNAGKARTAEDATTAEKVTSSLGDMPMAKLKVVINDDYRVTTVSFLGKKFYKGESSALSVPAYSPVFLSVSLKEYENIISETEKDIYTYTVTINGVPFDNIAGSYEKAGDHVVNTFKTESFSSATEFMRTGSSDMTYSNRRAEFYHNRTTKAPTDMILCRVLDNLIDYNEGTNSSNMASEFVSPLNIAISSYHDNEAFNLGHGWSDISDKRLGFQVYSDTYAYQYTPVLTHFPANPSKYVSPIYAEVPNFIYINSFTTETSYKVGTHPTELDANMVNQVVGPFDQEENTIVITVKKEHRKKVN